MTDLPTVRRARGFALLIRPWPPVEKYAKPNQIVLARRRGQLELFPLEKPKPPAFQLRLSLMGGFFWGYLRTPPGEKAAD